jgi:hypothetical protein
MTKKQEAESAKATAEAQPAKADEPTTVDASFTEVDKEEKK